MLERSVTRGNTPFWLILLAAVIALFLGTRFMTLLSASAPHNTIDRGIEYIVETESLTSAEAALGLPKGAWRAQQTESLLFLQPERAVWLKFPLQNLSLMEQWLLEIYNPALNNVDIWFFEGDTLLSNYRTGDRFAFRTRALATEQFLFPVPASAKNSITVLLRVDGNGQYKVPIRLWKQSNYLVHGAEQSLIIGLFLGFMFAMTLSNFFFFIFSRSVNFLWYCGYALSVALLLMSLLGLGFKYLWPNSIWMQNHSAAIFTSSSLFFAILFMRQLLGISERFAKVDWGLKLLALSFLTAIALGGLQDNYGIVQFFLVSIIAVMLVLFGLGMWLRGQGVQISSLYFMAWITLSATVTMASLGQLGILRLELTTPYLLMLGATIETILLALLLAQNFSQQSKELLMARETALDQEKQITAAKEEVIATQLQANEELEYKVQERTLELQVALRELAESNRELEEKNTMDALTGIRNRRYFDKKFLAEARRSRREQTSLAVAMIDIDHFKSVNDEYGHIVGDECLKHIAGVIQSFLKRPSDEVCRYGGEEFVILMPSTSADGAQTILEKIRAHIAHTPLVYSAGELPATISVGYSSKVISSDDDQHLLLDAADKALYQSKNDGRNRITFQAPIEQG